MGINVASVPGESVARTSYVNNREIVSVLGENGRGVQTGVVRSGNIQSE